jgi:TldD protein
MSFELGIEGLELASRLEASYSDIRIGDVYDRGIQVQNGSVSTAQTIRTGGFGVRVLVDGAWGFAGSTDLTSDEVKVITEKAIKIAKASKRVRKHNVELLPSKPNKGSYETPMKTDPFNVDTHDIIEVLMKAERTISDQSPLIKSSSAFFRAYKDKKLLLTSEGAEIEQEITWCGGRMGCIALRSGETQPMHYPDRRGRYCTSGYEHFESLDFPGEAERIGKEAVALLDADKLTEHKTDLILRHDLLMIQVHESCGHPTELDRVLGTEADSAGTSFVTPDKLGKFMYGSEAMNLVADSTDLEGMGGFGYDDDGIPAKKTHLIKDGKFVNYQSSRETAAEFGLEESSGGSRAKFAFNLPLVRMTNINLIPSGWKWEEIIEDTKKGVLMTQTKSNSIDDLRLSFLFGAEMGWEIKNGSKEKMLKNCIYTGITPEFWRSLDAVSRDDWLMHGSAQCGKGMPSQEMPCGHRVSTARFRDVRVWSE